MKVMTGNVLLLSDGKSDVFPAVQPFRSCCGQTTVNCYTNFHKKESSSLIKDCYETFAWMESVSQFQQFYPTKAWSLSVSEWNLAGNKIQCGCTLETRWQG